MSKPAVRRMPFDRASVRGLQMAAHQGRSANGAKTVTRRLALAWSPKCVDRIEWLEDGRARIESAGQAITIAPSGQPGELVYIGEPLEVSDGGCVQYQADDALVPAVRWRWQPRRLAARYCPRALTRMSAYIESVSLERLSAITPESAIAEGLTCVSKDRQTWKYGIADTDGWPDGDGWAWSEWSVDPVQAYARRWDELNAGSAGVPFSADPLVWVYQFEPLPVPVSTVLAHPERYGPVLAAHNEEKLS